MNASRDDNRVPNIAGVSSIAFTGSIEPAVDPTTHELLVKPGQLTPTQTLNPSTVLTRNGSNYITTIALTIGGTTYTQTITRNASNYITNISAFV